MIKFLAASNLTVQAVDPCIPWEFKIISPISDIVRSDKLARQDWYQNPSTKHQFYTGIVGANGRLRVSNTNPAKAIRAAIFDIDLKLSSEKIIEYASKLPRKPIFWERSLGGCFRFVFVFESEVPVDGNEFCSFYLRALAEKILKMDGKGAIVPGVDPCYLKAMQLYANGGQWYPVEGGKPVPEADTQALRIEAVKEYDFKPGSEYDIPLDVVENKIRSLFPRFDWPGPFALETQGPSFWLLESTSPMSAIVKGCGMLTFAAHADQPFYTWGDILGEEFVAEFRHKKITEATKDTYWDGNKFWLPGKNGRWDFLAEKNLIRRFSCRGLSQKSDKGKKSAMEDAVAFIEEHNRIDATAPFIFNSERMVVHGGKRYLNTYIDQVIRPADEWTPWGTEGKFPFLSEVLDRLLKPHSQLNHLLAWWKVFYLQALNKAPTLGQNIFIQGISGTGKSFTSRYVIAYSVGGFAEASRMVLGKEQFGGENYEYGCWCVDDETINDTDEDRRKFTNFIKTAASNCEMFYHVKHERTARIEWRGRIIITLNTDLVSSRILPMLDEATRRKFSFFRATDVKDWEWPATDEIIAMRDREIPYLLRWLHDWEPPSEIGKDDRFLVQSYHDSAMENEALLASSAAPFREMATIAMERYFKAHPTESFWEGSTTALLVEINLNPELSPFISKIPSSTAGKNLEMLSRASDFCSGIRKVHNTRIWRIPRNAVLDTPPAPLSEQQPPIKDFNEA